MLKSLINEYDVAFHGYYEVMQPGGDNFMFKKNERSKR